MPIKKSELYSSLWRSCDELRGGMDASQYKDYVLVLLFMKYVSDKAGSQRNYVLQVPKGGSFADMAALKGDKEIGDKINKIIAKLAEKNELKGVIDVADFNDSDKLGRGQQMVDRLSRLVAIFEGLDFGRNRAEGDDLLGDAYEYLMRHFATESGKSKGQFYTPAEVSRIMAKVIGAGSAKSQQQTIYDPACGSGSLLIKAHDEAKGQTGHDLAIYGQEMDNATRALARMNTILHDCPTAEVEQGNTLADPHFRKRDGLETFDFVVANPPFSTKAWSSGFNPAEDQFRRFPYGLPPARNGDYAFLLHILASLKSAGKGAREDVAGLLEDRLTKAREHLEDALEALRALCEPVAPPRDDEAFYRFFSSEEPGNAEQLKSNEPQRLGLYQLTAELVRAYAGVANEMPEAGYSGAEAEAIKQEVTFYENLRAQVKLHSGDAIDLKRYEPAMRHLIDTYIRAEESEKVSAFDDLSLVRLIVERGAGALDALPEAIRRKEKIAAETIENNVRRLIIDEAPINPKYYEKMSALLDALIAQRRQDALNYQQYLEQIVDLTRKAKNGPNAATYPAPLDSAAKRALYDNLGSDEVLALKVDQGVRTNTQDGWRNNVMKLRRVRLALLGILGNDAELTDRTLEIIKNQHEY